MIGEAEPAQFLGAELAFGRAVNVATVAVVGLAAGDGPLQRPVKRGRFVAPMMIRREARHRAVIPKSFEAQEGLAAGDPALWRGKRSQRRRPPVPAGTPASRHFAEEPADRVHIEGRPPRGGFLDRLLDARREEPTAAETPHAAVTEEGVTVHELQQVRLDVRAHDAVGFDDGAGFGIDVVPRASDLRTQPAAQGAEQVGEGLPVAVRATHALAVREQVRIEGGPAALLDGTGVPAGSFDNDLVHVRAHLRG